VKVGKVGKCVFHGVPGFENLNGVFHVQEVKKVKKKKQIFFESVMTGKT
jgi:hypothetical protein